MPSIKVVPEGDPSRRGYELVQDAFGPGAPGALQVVVAREEVTAATGDLRDDAGIARVAIAGESETRALLQATPLADPSDPAVGETVDRLRDALPADSLVGGAAAENHDLEEALSSRTPLVVGVVLMLGFLLLLASQAPLIAAVGVLTNLLATAAAFGVARLVFQEGIGAGLLGFESQGFVDAWGPCSSLR